MLAFFAGNMSATVSSLRGLRSARPGYRRGDFENISPETYACHRVHRMRCSRTVVYDPSSETIAPLAEIGSLAEPRLSYHHRFDLARCHFRFCPLHRRVT